MNLTDLTFITNQDENNMSNRLKVLLKSSSSFDVLVGYFFISGFYKIYKDLEHLDKIRILVGIGTDSEVANAVQTSLLENIDSISNNKKQLAEKIKNEVEESEDSVDIEDGILKFVEWIKTGKLIVKMFDKSSIHAKIYIFSFKEGEVDSGRIITGSSNLSRSGLIDNLEFNVELKNSQDYRYALEEFEKLWLESVDVSEKIEVTVSKQTHLNDSITPYELYLKFLYEYFREDLTVEDELEGYTPEGYLELDYQKQAVINAKKILEDYGGVFISDVVGLGKTYIAARLINSLEGKTLVLASPTLISDDNPGSWSNVFRDFGVRRYKCESIGKLDKILSRENLDSYKNIVIDESHTFRNESTKTFDLLAQICKEKRIILVSATPFNNSPKDLLSQIKLFQHSRNSNIPGIRNLEAYFSKLTSRLEKLDRQKDYEEYMETVKQNAVDIRKNILKYLMVRRTRSEIQKYYKEDLEAQGLKFPKVEDPQPIFYKFDEEENEAFNKTLEFIKNFKYSRYTPLLYYTGELKEQERNAQTNMKTFMKILLLKRFESSLYAFEKTLNRFIRSYELMIEEYEKGCIYISKKNANKVFQLLEEGRIEDLMKLVEEGKSECYQSDDFIDEFKTDLYHDLSLLNELSTVWDKINRDIKLQTFLEKLINDQVLKNNKLIIFTESKETANYLSEQIQEGLGEKVLNFTGGSSEVIRREALDNFDGKVKNPKNDFRILVTTEVLAEGVNLHQSNVVINYDIPWNPTRIMQRVGRINRVDTKFDKIYTYNCFPSVQSNDHLKLKEAAEAKIRMFIELLGNDARLLTEGEEIKSQELFDKLSSKETIVGEEEGETELKYLSLIKELREKDFELFKKIKNLPKKSRSSRELKDYSGSLLTYFQKGKMDKFVVSNDKGSKELGFLDAIKLFECKKDTKRLDNPKELYLLLAKNKEFFEEITSEESLLQTDTRTGAKDRKIAKRLNANFMRLFDGFTEEEEEYLELVKTRIDEGALTKGTAKKVWEKIKDLDQPLEIIRVLRSNIPKNLLKDTYVQTTSKDIEKKTVILSEYFK